MSDIRTRYRIDFEKHQWFFTSPENIKTAIFELNTKRVQVYEVTEHLDEQGNVIKTCDKEIKERELQ